MLLQKKDAIQSEAVQPGPTDTSFQENKHELCPQKDWNCDKAICRFSWLIRHYSGKDTSREISIRKPQSSFALLSMISHSFATPCVIKYILNIYPFSDRGIGLC